MCAVQICMCSGNLGWAVLINIDDFGAEWPESQSCHLKGLYTEWYADNSTKIDQSGKNVYRSEHPSESERPDNIKDTRGQAAVIDNGFPEWGEGQTRHFEALGAERYPDDSNAQDASDKEPEDGGLQTSEEDPEYIAQ